MNIKIEFFKDDFIEAIGAGVYEIDVCYKGKESALYIGESVFALVRCASHLHKLKNNPSLFGFDKINIENPEITLKFQLIKQENDALTRKALETELIKERKPLSQRGIRDYQKDMEEKILALTSFLENA